MDADELLKNCTENSTLTWDEHRAEIQRVRDEQFASIMTPLLAAAHATSGRVDSRVTQVFSVAFRHAMDLKSDANIEEMDAVGKSKIDDQVLHRLVNEYKKMMGA